MSVLTDVLDVARKGATTTHIAAELGIDLGLAEAALDHWVRLGIVTRAGDATSTGCHGCVEARDASRASDRARSARPLSCAGCVFARG